MRELTSHKVDGLNESIYIGVMDEPGAGGAHHVYDLSPMREVPPKEGCSRSLEAVEDAQVIIRFQNGPIAESGVNGVSNEALLAIVEDRLWCFQNGPYACDENHIALERVRDAMDALKSRTLDRIARGVEGTHEK